MELDVSLRTIPGKIGLSNETISLRFSLRKVSKKLREQMSFHSKASMTFSIH